MIVGGAHELEVVPSSSIYMIVGGGEYIHDKNTSITVIFCLS